MYNIDEDHATIFFYTAVIVASIIAFITVIDIAFWDCKTSLERYPRVTVKDLPARCLKDLGL